MRTFGYLLGNGLNRVLFQKETALLIPMNPLYKPLRLRKTMLRLLEFILEQSSKGLIQDEMIMNKVWEGFGLRASVPRLWQVMADLKKRLITLGIDDDIILRVEGAGYIVDTEKVEPVYIKKEYDSLLSTLINHRDAMGSEA